MKMKKYVVGFVAGVLVGSMSVGAFAATGLQTIKATYKNIKVAVNNSVVALKDANGKTVEPFVSNGTTYLPVRGVATALGQEVSWDASTNTVYIGKQPTKTPSSTSSTVSQEYKNALKSAQDYSEMFHMSKQALYDQLTSEYGGKFPADAAQYAVDNVNADWNYNALKSAETYYKDMSMSKDRVYDQLTSQYGGKFTAEQAQYAVDHLA